MPIVIVTKPIKFKSKTLGFDIETDSTKAMYANIKTIAIYDPEDDTRYVLPIDVKQKERNLPKEVVVETLKNAFKCNIVGHYLQFDLSIVFRHYGLLPKIARDTIILARMRQETEQSLESLAQKYLGLGKSGDFTTTFNPLVSDDRLFYEVDLENEKHLAYIAEDPVVPIKLEKVLSNFAKFQDRNIYEMESRVLPYFVRMRVLGLRVNREVYFKKLPELEKQIHLNEMRVNELAGRPVKVNSSRDVAKLLFEEMRLPESPIKTAKGNPSVSEEALSFLEGYEIVDAIVNAKKSVAELSGSIKLQNYLDENDRIHPEFLQIGFDGTARVYSTEPSVNQYPLGLRECIIPSEGKKFLYFDLSSAELYIAAKWAGEDELVEHYENGGDAHTWICQRLLGIENPTKSDREVSKIVTFATIFGSEGGAVARNLKISDIEAERIVKKYRQVLPKLEQLRQEIMANAEITGYTKSYFGRNRQLLNITNYLDIAKGRRQAFNNAIQFSCADCQKLIIPRLFEVPGFEVKFSVFDSFLVEIPEDMTDNQIRPILEKICQVNNLKLRFKFSTGYNWKEVQEKA